MYKVEVKNKTIEYFLSRRAKKNINITFKSDGNVYVSAPKRVPLSEIEDVIKDKLEWINEKKQNMPIKKIEFGDRRLIWYKGVKYKVKIVPANKNGVEILGNMIIIYSKDENEEYLKNIYSKWLCNEAKEVYSKEVSRWINIMDEYSIKIPSIQIRKMQSRWGSCIPSKNKICLNIALMKVPVACMEYVVLHELVHFIEPNHSKNFYTIVEKYMSDWKTRKHILDKEFGNIL